MRCTRTESINLSPSSALIVKYSRRGRTSMGTIETMAIGSYCRTLGASVSRMVSIFLSFRKRIGVRGDPPPLYYYSSRFLGAYCECLRNLLVEAWCI